MSDELTKEQIQNWRYMLVGILGSYALVMSDEDVQAFRDAMQKEVNEGAPTK